jgi:hypothetical protein
MHAIGKQTLQSAWNSFVYLLQLNRQINKRLNFLLSVRFEILRAVKRKIRTIPHPIFWGKKNLSS